MRVCDGREIITRNFGIAARELASQLGHFQASAEVQVVIHDDATAALESLCSKFAVLPEPGQRFELRLNVGGLLAKLREFRDDDRVHALVYRGSVAAAPRRCSPRAVIASSAGGRVAEIHVDSWRWAERIPYDRTLDIEIDLDEPKELTHTNNRIAPKPLSIWTKGRGWAREGGMLR